MDITISEIMNKINEAIASGNNLAGQLRQRTFQYHDILETVLREQILQGTPGDKKIITLSGSIKGHG